MHGQVRIVAKGRPQASAIVFYADGATIGNAPPFAATWNSSGASAGLHILKVVAYDSSGNVLASAQTAVFTSTGVAITTPINGTTASGPLIVTCVAAAKARRVDLSLDGARVASSPPLTFQVASTSLSDGPHTITAAALGAKNKSLGTYSISINVRNHTGSPTPTATPTPTAVSTPTPGGTATPLLTPSPQPTPGPGGRAYYVTPVGDDSNNGTSSATPWRSVAKVNATRFNPGDVIYFATDSLWREMLSPEGGGDAGNPVTFAAYGGGAQPTLSGSDVVSGWILDSGQSYRASLGRQPANVYVDGGPSWGLPKASSASAMAPGTWFWDGSDLFVQLSDGSDPSGHVVEAATRLSGFSVSTGRCAQFSNIRIHGLRFERTGGFGIYLHCFSGPDLLTGIIVDNNTVSQTGTGRVDGGQYYNGIHFLQEPLGLDAAPQILNNVVSFTGGHGNGLNIQGANNAYIAGNDVSNWNHNGIDVKNATGVVVDQNLLHDQPSFGAGLYAEYSSVTWQRNLVADVFMGAQVSVATTANVYNNSVYSAATGFYFGPSGTSVSLVNNAMNKSTVAFGTDGNGTFSEDYNDWGQSALFQIGSVQFQSAAWKSLHGGTHDLYEDPMWQSPGNRVFTLLSGSPCIAAGADVGLPFTGAAPNMGAVQQP